MENSDDSRRPEPHAAASDEETIASLIRLAGPRLPVPPERLSRVWSTVHTHWRHTVRRLRRRRVALWLAGSLAIAAAVLVTAGLGLRHRFLPPPAGAPTLARAEALKGRVLSNTSGVVEPGDAITAGDEVTTSADARAALRLADRTSLRIDAESRLFLTSESVLVLHQGAVYVDTSRRGPATPRLEIRTPLGTATDIGTQFEVRLGKDSMTLRVRDGLVDLMRGPRTYRAEAGQQLLANVGGEVATSSVPLHGGVWSWTLEIAPSFDLEGRSLAEFLTWVARETGWSLRFEEASIAARAPSLILHGSIEGLRPDEAPAAVLPTCGLRHRLVDGTLTIESMRAGK